MRIQKAMLGAAVAALLAVVSCQKDANSDQQPTLSLRLTDGPALYEAVNLDIQGAEIHVTKDISSASGWQALTVKKGIYNILKLSNGVDTLLGTTTLPVGDVKQVRLILGNNNSVRVNGQTYPMTVPSGSESGLKVKFDKKLLAGVDYTLTLDVDAARSIKEEKNNTFKLRPVVRVITEANNGSIRGEISPVSCKSVVYAINGTDTLTSAIPTALGRFVLPGLDAGTYRIVVDAETCTDKVQQGVKVEVGKSTDVGKIQLQ